MSGLNGTTGADGGLAGARFDWRVFTDNPKRARRLSATALVVYCCLVAHAGKQDRKCYVRQSVLAAECGLHRSCVNAAISELVINGFITKEGSATGGTAMKYTILPVPEPVAQDDRSAPEPVNGEVGGGVVLGDRGVSSETTGQGPNLSSRTTGVSSRTTHNHNQEPIPITNPPLPPQGGKKKPSPHPERHAEAVKVVDHYQRVIQPAQTKARGVKNVTALLSRDLTAEQLCNAADGYAAFIAARGRAPAYRKAVGNFYGRDADYEEFLNYQSPKPREQMTDAERAEHDRKSREEWLSKPYTSQ